MFLFHRQQYVLYPVAGTGLRFHGASCLKSTKFLFDRDLWTSLKQESSPCSCSSLSLMTAGLQLIFYKFDLHTEDKPGMTAAADKELHFVKGRQYNHMT